jgi:CO dehydrogenase/acetyl-CoA synthase beta subunit
MNVFDRVIEDTVELLSPNTPRRWAYSSETAWKETNANELVLQRNAAFELGGGKLPAVTYSCATSSPSLIAVDEVLLYGADLGEIRFDVPFARIVMLKIADVAASTTPALMSPAAEDPRYKAIKDIEFVKYKVFPQGYMMRAGAFDQREQVRVGKEAVAAGISFASVGCSYIRKYKENPLVEAVRLVFVTEELAVFKDLIAAARKTADITAAMSHILKSLSTDCHSCNMKPICDEVDGLRELHFKTAAN